MFSFRWIASSLTLLAMTVSFAVHASTADELAKAQKEIETAKAHQAELSKQDQKIESELSELQQKLISSAQAVQEGEANVSASEEKLSLLNDQLEKKSEVLAAKRKKLAALIAAALRLSNTPAESVVMMPGDTEQTIKAARALKMTEAGIKQDMEGVRLEVAGLTALKEKIARHHAEVAGKQENLSKERQALAAKLAERKALSAKLHKQEAQESEKIAQLAKKADDLQELMSSIKQEEKRWRQRDEAEARGHKGKLRSFAAAKGHIRPPVSGKTVIGFGESDGRNDTSKGLSIAARGGAEVVAPYDGEVVFTGPFLNYGKMVILKHSDDFHTLLAGLAKIDVSQGEFLLEGEPIGAMGEGDRLYIELRKDNQPIDPQPWMGKK